MTKNQLPETVRLNADARSKIVTGFLIWQSIAGRQGTFNRAVGSP
jgi:hypothetical protein